MQTHPTRRALLKAGAAATALPLLPALAQERRFEPQVAGWRTFEVTTQCDVADVKGATRLWLPVPDVNSEYQQSLDSTWAGNATSARLVVDPKSSVRMLYAEYAESVSAPTLALTSRVRTRNRAVDWTKPETKPEDSAVLQTNLKATELIPLDGIVRKTALEATQGRQHRCRQGARHLRLGGHQRAPRAQDARLRHRRHQGDARERQPRRQVRRPERDLRRPVPHGGRAGARHLRPARGAVGVRLPRARCQPGQLEGCAALPRRGLHQGPRLGRDGPGRRAAR